MEQFGEPPTATGNDYQCGSPGGPPRSGRTARAGESTSWTSDPPTAATSPTTAAPLRSKAAPTNSRRPGLACCRCLPRGTACASRHETPQELYRQAQAILQAAPLGEFPHHLGHGIGLFPHEALYINPHWDDHFQVGEVFTIEPGLYCLSCSAVCGSSRTTWSPRTASSCSRRSRWKCTFPCRIPFSSRKDLGGLPGPDGGGQNIQSDAA